MLVFVDAPTTRELLSGSHPVDTLWQVLNNIDQSMVMLGNVDESPPNNASNSVEASTSDDTTTLPRILTAADALRHHYSGIADIRATAAPTVINVIARVSHVGDIVEHQAATKNTTAWRQDHVGWAKPGYRRTVTLFDDTCVEGMELTVWRNHSDNIEDIVAGSVLVIHGKPRRCLSILGRNWTL